MRLKSFNSTMGKNLKMNDNTYTLRRKVMDEIYVAKNLLRSYGIQLPRIDVRITDNQATCKHATHALGQAELNNNIIWISEKGLNYGNLRHIVFHEIVHAVTGFCHDENCPLMQPTAPRQPLSETALNQAFIKYFKK